MWSLINIWVMLGIIIFLHDVNKTDCEHIQDIEKEFDKLDKTIHRIKYMIDN